jgi:hypothetical protein
MCFEVALWLPCFLPVLPSERLELNHRLLHSVPHLDARLLVLRCFRWRKSRDAARLAREIERASEILAHLFAIALPCFCWWSLKHRVK